MAGLERDLKVAALSPTGTGDQTGIAAVVGKSIRITSLVLVASAATTVTLKSGTGTSLSGPMQLAANGGLSITSPDSKSAVLLCALGEAFTINQSADGVDGWAVYYLS